MKAWTSVAAIVGLAFLVGVGSMAQAQFKPNPAPGGGGSPPAPGDGAPGGGGTPDQGDQFKFRVCNKSKVQLFVALLYKTGGNNWRSVGWVSYKPSECAPVRGMFPRNDFYWYAEDAPGNVTYAGKDAYGCVNPKDGFDRTITGDYQCAANEKIVGFNKIDEQSIRDGVTLTD